MSVSLVPTLSSAELQFIQQGVELDVRTDGRSRLEYRYFHVETAVVPAANGSARVHLQGTDVLCVVKMELAAPSPETPDRGSIDCSIDCTAMASPDPDQFTMQAFTSHLTSELERVLVHSHAIDLRRLCASKGKYAWHVHLDMLVFSNAGNVVDALSIAARAALLTTEVPSIQVVKGDDGTFDVIVSDDPFASEPFPCAKSVPVVVTVARIGSEWILDPSDTEEASANVRLSVAVSDEKDESSSNATSCIRGVWKSGVGAVHASKMPELLTLAQTSGLRLMKLIRDATSTSVAAAQKQKQKQ